MTAVNSLDLTNSTKTKQNRVLSVYFVFIRNNTRNFYLSITSSSKMENRSAKCLNSVYEFAVLSPFFVDPLCLLSSPELELFLPTLFRLLLSGTGLVTFCFSGSLFLRGRDDASSAALSPSTPSFTFFVMKEEDDISLVSDEDVELVEEVVDSDVV